MHASVQLVIGVRVTREELFTQGMPEYRCDNGHKRRPSEMYCSQCSTLVKARETSVPKPGLVAYAQKHGLSPGEEYRLFVHRGEIVGCRHYTGDYATPIDFDVARAAVEAFRSAPVGYSLDMGRTDDGRTLVVEVNDAFALGSYGLPSVRYADLVLDRWAEIVGLLEVKS